MAVSALPFESCLRWGSLTERHPELQSALLSCFLVMFVRLNIGKAKQVVIVAGD